MISKSPLFFFFPLTIFSKENSHQDSNLIDLPLLSQFSIRHNRGLQLINVFLNRPQPELVAPSRDPSPPLPLWCARSRGCARASSSRGGTQNQTNGQRAPLSAFSLLLFHRPPRQLWLCALTGTGASCKICLKITGGDPSVPWAPLASTPVSGA